MFPKHLKTNKNSSETKSAQQDEKKDFQKALDEAKEEILKPKKNEVKPVSLSSSVLPPHFNNSQLLFNDSGQKFDELIKKYSMKNGLDPELVKRLVEIESNFDPNAISKKGALGLMQLMPETARDLGIKNPFNPEENIAGGTKYLLEMLKENSGDLRLALAGYNAGPNAVKEYEGIPPFPETQEYVRKILHGFPDEKIREIKKKYLTGDLEIPMKF
ncbi:MAG: lytic transglycosylase domain-containing protein [Candidatus Riflebacteria bacterium]|nr:lytic transglycosylase domain-containing protein [Candidatus Riflebacteria bacterium]